jgi:hypothetical protein
MNHGRLDPARDPRMARAIRAAGGDAPPRPDHMRALHDRITRAARPRLAEQRNGSPSWLDYAAGWSRTIVPLGVATAVVAASCLVWLTITPRQQAPGTVEHVAVLAAATNAAGSGDLIDLAISDVDMPASAPVPSSEPRVRFR